MSPICFIKIGSFDYSETMAIRLCMLHTDSILPWSYTAIVSRTFIDVTIGTTRKKFEILSLCINLLIMICSDPLVLPVNLLDYLIQQKPLRRFSSAVYRWQSLSNHVQPEKGIPNLMPTMFFTANMKHHVSCSFIPSSANRVIFWSLFSSCSGNWRLFSYIEFTRL